MSKRNLYLTNMPPDEALQRYFEALRNAGGFCPSFESVSVPEALGRVSKEAVFARCCSPLFNAAAMDGIAVVAEETAGARESAPLLLRPDSNAHAEGGFMPVDTGDPIRHPYNAVIMAEDLLEGAEGAVRILASAAPWQHVRPIGEDIVVGEMLVPGRHKIRPEDLGVLLSGGVTRLNVYKKPRVAIIPTGTEIIDPSDPDFERAMEDTLANGPNTLAESGRIIESNSRMFEGMVNQSGGLGMRFVPLPDDYELLKAAIDKAAQEYDMVLVNAGSSAGREDYTVHIVRELGQVVAHGISIKPGKPTILGIVRGKPVIGLPGYPVSACIAYENFAAPALAVLAGRNAAPPQEVEAVIARRLVSSLKHKEFVRVKLGRVDGRLVAAPLARGAGAAMSLVRSDGFCVIEQNSEGVEAGDPVRVILRGPLENIEKTLVVIGSHDLLLDVLADLMSASGQAFLASTHVGSLGGLMGLKRGEAHLAPVHLLDEKTGVYNLASLKSVLPGEKMLLVKGVGRVQGIMTPKGNPLNIKTISDLPGKRFVNRQRGAGTRVLFDYKLAEAGIASDVINGYQYEVVTHMAVAAAVAGGAADAGLGVYSAAQALGLDFAPVGTEEYDFALPERFLNLPQTQAFLEALRGTEFRQRLEKVGGYSFERSGEIIRLE